MEDNFEWYIDRLLARSKDKVGCHQPGDDETITWGELRLSIENMAWFIEDEQPDIRKGAEWILRHVVRSLVVQDMSKKGLL